MIYYPSYQKIFSYIASRIHQVQDYFQSPILLENLSHYTQFKTSEMVKLIFNELQTSRVRLLLDINNVYG